MAANLVGLANDWEGDPQIRELVRVKGSLFRPALRCAAPALTIACGEQNFQVLKPIASRLRLDGNHVGQVMVPHLVRESFILNGIIDFIVFVCFIIIHRLWQNIQKFF